MTLLAASILADAQESLALQCHTAVALGADAIEIRLDSYEADVTNIRGLISSFPHLTWILTCRSAGEGGLFQGDTDCRVSRLIECARGTNAFVDFELADWRRSANIRQKILLAARGEDGRTRLILSRHQFTPQSCDASALVSEILTEKAALPSPQDILVAKVAYAGRSILDSFAALDALHRFGNQAIVICMGQCGLWTRVLAKKLGAFLTYASLSPEHATAPGQVTIADMFALYRWHALNPNSALYGVIGDPVAHSLSPRLHNRWSNMTGTDAVYLPLLVSSGGGELEAALHELARREWLNVGGLSVTIPHKEKILELLSGQSDSLSRTIGAVNTLVRSDDHWFGYNTDSHAAVDSLLAALGMSRQDLFGMTIDILGAGGAARALIEPLRNFGARLIVYARSEHQRRAIEQEFQCQTLDWSRRIHCTGEVLVNATPIGMWPDMDATPIPADSLNHCRLVFDLIYRPRQTRLLKDAQARGCKTLSGLDMFIRQAAMQFELWTRIAPDREAADVFLERILRLDLESNRSLQSRPVICLIGLRGAGKTTVGHVLAKLLAVPHIDTDTLVVKESGHSIAEIFAREGEAGFRNRECRALQNALQHPPVVISAGGGAVTHPQSRKLLQQADWIIWLNAPPDLLWSRVHACPATAHARPPLTDLSGLDEMRQLAAAREQFYVDLADLRLDTSHLTPQEIAQVVFAVLQFPTSQR